MNYFSYDENVILHFQNQLSQQQGSKFGGQSYLKQQPSIEEYMRLLMEHNVPQSYSQSLMRTFIHKPQEFNNIIKAFKAGGRLKPLELGLKNNTNYLKPEEVYENQKQMQQSNRNKAQEINKELVNEQFYDMILENRFFQKINSVKEKKVSDFITQYQNSISSDDFFWAIVVEKQQIFQKEVLFLAQNQFKEHLQINIIGKDILNLHKEFIPGWTDEDINNRLQALQAVVPGDIIGIMGPTKNLDYEAYVTLNVKINQVFIIKRDVDLDQFFDKQMLKKPMNQLQMQQKRIFVEKYKIIRSTLWSENNFVDLIKILTKACYYDEVVRFCHQFMNLHLVGSSKSTKQELYKTLFISNMKRGYPQDALNYYLEAQKEGMTLDQYKEETVQILFSLKYFEEIRKKFPSLDKKSQDRLQFIIEQTNLILDFKNEGKNFKKIAEMIKQNKNFGQYIQNYYGPIEIREATIECGREDKVKKIGRGVFLTQKVKQRQLLWAERDLTYQENKKNDVKIMFEYLKSQLSNDLLRVRLKYIYRDGMRDYLIPEVSLYNNEKYDLQKQGFVPKIADNELYNIVNSSSHRIYPKINQSDQSNQEEGLWPIFSFVNHSISNRNIEVVVLSGFLFVFSTVSLPKDTQIFYNYVLNIQDESIIRQVMSKYALPEL